MLRTFIFPTLSLIILAGIAALYLSWWSIVITSMLVGFIFHKGSIKSFLTGSLGIFLLWSIAAIWLNFQNGGTLSSRMAELFQLSGGWQLILVTGIVGAIMGGFSCVSGHYIWKLLFPAKQ